MTIHIGEIYGDLKWTEFKGRMSLIKLQFPDRPSEIGLGDVGQLDLAFHVTGKYFQPEFEGLRTGKFSRKKKMLQVQIAVPLDVRESPQPEPYIFEKIRESIELAGPVFAKAKIKFPKDEYLKLVDEVEAKPRGPSVKPQLDPREERLYREMGIYFE